jgi:hypothetical protein
LHLWMGVIQQEHDNLMTVLDRYAATCEHHESSADGLSALISHVASTNL